MAFSEHYSLLMDLPLFWDPQLLERKVHKVTFYPEMQSRFGILPRYGTNADVKWFEATPCYIYHVVNAWEDGDEFVMDACRVIQAEPGAKKGEGEHTKKMTEVVLKLSDADIDGLFELATTDGIVPLIRQTAAFNHHREFIVALLKHPPARRLLFKAAFA